MLVSLKNNKYSSGESLDVENEFFFIYTIIQREEELGTRYFHSKKKPLRLICNCLTQTFLYFIARKSNEQNFLESTCRKYNFRNLRESLNLNHASITTSNRINLTYCNIFFFFFLFFFYRDLLFSRQIPAKRMARKAWERSLEPKNLVSGSKSSKRSL